MSNSILPHLLSDSPPPLVADDEEFEDEFGDFKGSEELSFDNDNPSTPSSLKNSNDYFPDTYTDFNLCNVEERYQIIETPQDKSTANVRNSIPSSDYFTQWEHIENNIPEIIDNDENLRIISETVNRKGEKFNIQLSVKQSNENSHSSNYQDEETDFQNGMPSKSTEETEPNSPCLELSCSLEGNEDYNEIKHQNGDSPTESNSVSQICVDDNDENCMNLSSTENNSETEFHNLHIVESEFPKGKIIDERTNVADFHVSGSLGNHSTQKDYSTIHLSEADNCESRIFEESDSVESNALVVHKFENLPSEKEETQSENDFGEFADFSSSQINNVPFVGTEANSVKTDDEDDFNKFESYKFSCVDKNDVDPSKSCDTTQNHTECQKVNTEEIDEFDDFASYSGYEQSSSRKNNICESQTLDEALKICKNPEEAFKETQNVLEKIFVIGECTTPEYSNCEFVMDNSVFENLKDITETNALTYQWGKSVAQKNILKTLNIDIRNILYGPTWNSGMPIFAPNLCSKPLEPIKSELPIPISPQKVIEPQESTISTTPQFDWSGSGLTNLQDSPVNVEKEIHTNLQGSMGEFELIQPSYAVSVPIEPKLNYSEEKRSQYRDVEVLNEVENCQEITDDFSDFTSYQGEVEKEPQWKNMLPLRESHISSNVQQDNVEIDKISLYFQELTTGKSHATAIDQLEQNSKSIGCDKSLRFFENDQGPAESPFVFNDKPRIKKERKTSQTNPTENSIYYEKDISNHCNVSVDNSPCFKTEEMKHNDEDIVVDESSNKHHEDEFTDFQSSLPCRQELQIQPALLEPLKPAILRPEPIKSKNLKIEWPEPGLDEDEINRIVNGVLRKNSTSEKVVEKTSDITPTKNGHSKPVQKNDNDDWSDFISVKEPLKSRTSTPDLPLSVFNLGSIQPNKVSAPFVDPNGVVHSPSKTSSVGLPLANRNFHNGAQQPSHRQPFITSQAFDALYLNSPNNILQPSSSRKSVDIKESVNQFTYEEKMNMCANRSEQNNGIFSQSGRNYKDQKSSGTCSNAEDDDWGDFVSAPNTISHSNSSANFFQPLSYMKTNLGFGGKTASTQKFSTVPKNTVVKQERNNFPVISTMPDLDFVSPKSRSTIK